MDDYLHACRETVEMVYISMNPNIVFSHSGWGVGPKIS